MTEKRTYAEPVTVAVAVFHERRIAQNAATDLQRHGFQREQIGLVTSLDGVKRPGRNADVIGRDHAKGAIAGLVSGAIVGAIVGAADAVIVTASGLNVLAGLVAGAITGGVLGLILGILTGFGIPRRDRHYIDRRYDNFRTVLTVAANSRVAEAGEILRRNGGYDLAHQSAAVNIAGRSTPTMPAPAASTRTGDAQSMPRDDVARDVSRENMPSGRSG